MAVGKKWQIILLDRWDYAFETLTNEQIGMIIKAMVAYRKHGTEPAFNESVLRLFWVDVKRWLDDSQTFYDHLIAMRSKAGKASAGKRRNDVEQDEQVSTDVNECQQMLTDVNKRQQVLTSVNNAMQCNDNEMKCNDKPNDNEMPKEEKDHPSNIQTTSIITEGVSTKCQPKADDNAQGQPGKESTRSLDGWKEKNPQAEKITPANFKQFFKRSEKLPMIKIFDICNLRNEMIGSGADPAEVDRGIQKEIDSYNKKE